MTSTSEQARVLCAEWVTTTTAADTTPALCWAHRPADTINITYCELRQSVLHVVHALQAVKSWHGVSAVAVLIDEGPALVTAMLATLVAGGTVVPLDPRQPPARLKRMTEHADIAVVLATVAAPPQALDAVMEQGRTLLYLDIQLMPFCARAGSQDQQGLSAKATNRPDRGQSESQVACEQIPSHIFFTSGTTGDPKGVVGTRDGLHCFALAQAERYGITVASRMFVASASTFDPALGDIVTAMAVGATLCLAPRDRMVAELAACLQLTKATHVCSTPAIWLTMEHKGPANFPSLRTVTLGGERMPWALVKQWAAGAVRLFNTYGVTECTVYQTAYELTAEGLQDESASSYLGQPFPDVTCLVLDENLQLVPAGVEGELCLGGRQLCRGYIYPDPTGRFTALPSDRKEMRLFRTGDRVVQTSRGLRLLGRQDFQVKLNGQRVDFAEIEAVLEQSPMVARACVFVARLSSQQLVAFVELKAAHTHVESVVVALQLRLATWLPAYMIPRQILFVSPLPLTSSGKIDRAGLQERASVSAVAQPTSAQPDELSPFQEKVAYEWRRTLGVPAVGLADNFFDLGGDSLSALRICRRLCVTLLGMDADEYDPHAIGEVPEVLRGFHILQRPMLSEYTAYLAAGLAGRCVPQDGVTCTGPSPEATTAPASFLGVAVEKCQRALWEAARNGYKDVIQELLDAGIDTHGFSGTREASISPLHLAAQQGHTTVVQQLLAAGAKVTCFTFNHVMPAHFAAGGGHCDTLTCLLDAGSPMGARDKNRQSLLHWAARAGATACVQLLLSRHAVDVNAADCWHRTALHWSVLNGHVDTVDYLLSQPTVQVNFMLRHSVHHKETHMPQEAVLHLAARHCLKEKGYSILLAVLKTGQADIHLRTSNQATPLHVLVGLSPSNHEEQERLLSAAKVLLENGADPNAAGPYGATPLDLCTSNKTLYEVLQVGR